MARQQVQDCGQSPPASARWTGRRHAGREHADRGFPGAVRQAAMWPATCERLDAGRGRGGRGRRPAADLPGDVPHRLRDRPGGGARALAEPADGRRRRGPPRSPPSAASRCSTATPSAARTAGSSTPPCCSTGDGRRARQPPQDPPVRRLRPRCLRAGDGPPTLAELDGLQARHPDLLRCRVSRRTSGSLALRAPTWSPCPPPRWRRSISSCSTLVPARAYENQLFLAYANRCGQRGRARLSRPVLLVGPDGTDLARAGPGEELLLADVDPARLREPRAAQPLSRRPPARALRRLSPPRRTRQHDRRPRARHVGDPADPPARSPFRARTSRSPTTTGSRTRRASGSCRPTGTAPRSRSSAPGLPAWSPPTS